MKKKVYLSACLFLLVGLFMLRTCQAQFITQQDLLPYMWTSIISGDLTPLKPTTSVISPNWPFPIEVYEIVMMRARHQFLPFVYNSTEIFAYAGKVNGQFVASFPGPTLSVLKNMPCYVIYTNNITGPHILPVDTSPPFDMIAEYLNNEIPVVPHMHGLQTEWGSDGQPMGVVTKSGKKGPDFFSLRSASLKQNEMIFRYLNTKEGLFWYHDHAMGITRLNVYAGMVGLYQIIDPQISSQESNIMKMYGNIERKYFAIVDKTFKQDGQLYYPDQADSSNFQSWVPQFFGNTMTVNGKVWPRVVLRPKLYRFVILNGCQSRFLNIYFENNNRRLDFQIFRRDADFLRNPVTVQEHLLVLGGRIEIFLDLTNVVGEVTLKNNAATPYPMGQAPNEFMQQIMKIVTVPGRHYLQRVANISDDYLPKYDYTGSKADEIFDENEISSEPNTIISKIEAKMDLYTDKKQNPVKTLVIPDFMRQSQNKGPLLTSSNNKKSSSKEEQVTLMDFVNSNDQNALDDLLKIVAGTNLKKNQALQPLKSVQQSIALIQSKLENEIKNSKKNDQKKKQKEKEKEKDKSKNLDSARDISTSIASTPTSITNVPYPRFPEGTPYFPVLIEVVNDEDVMSGMFIDGVPLKMGCEESTFKVGEVYDFYIINLTMDDHPIHIHLVNFQIIGRFEIDGVRYQQDWQEINGILQIGGADHAPTQIDVRPYKIPQTDQGPLEEQKLFLDVILVPALKVTIARVKFSNHYGKPFPFSVQNSKYVWHCHILEHEDNQMMRYFCLE